MKQKTLTLIGLLALSGTVLAQDLKLSVNEKGKVGYTDAQGTIVIKQTYDAGTAFQNGFAKVKKGKKFGFINTAGNVVLPIKYDDLQEWGNGLYLATAGKVKSLVKSDGTTVLDKKLSHISKLNTYGRAWIAMGGKAAKSGQSTFIAKCKYGIINADGKELVTPTYKGIFEFSLKWDNAQSACGPCTIPYTYQMSTNDTLKTDCKYLIVSDNPLLSQDGGLIDGNTGAEIIKQNSYSLITAPYGGMARYYCWGNNSTVCGFFDLENKKDIKLKTYNMDVNAITFMTHGNFTGDIAPVNGETWSFVNRQGETVASGFTSMALSEPAESWAVTDGNGTYVIGFDGKKRLNGKTFEKVLLPITKENEVIYAVQQGGKWGILDANGNAKTEFVYDNALAPNFDWVLVSKDGKYGIVDADGQVVMDFVADQLALPTMKNPRYVWAQKDSLFYNYDIQRKTFSKMGYKVVDSNLDNGYASVQTEDFSVKQDVLQRIMLGRNPLIQIDDTTFTKLYVYFGNIIDANDNVCFPFPTTSLYQDKAIEAIKENGGKPISKGDAKKLLLMWSKNKRSYPLEGTIDEDNWDY